METALAAALATQQFPIVDVRFVLFWQAALQGWLEVALGTDDVWKTAIGLGFSNQFTAPLAQKLVCQLSASSKCTNQRCRDLFLMASSSSTSIKSESMFVELFHEPVPGSQELPAIQAARSANETKLLLPKRWHQNRLQSSQTLVSLRLAISGSRRTRQALPPCGATGERLPTAGRRRHGWLTTASVATGRAVSCCRQPLPLSSAARLWDWPQRPLSAAQCQGRM